MTVAVPVLALTAAGVLVWLRWLPRVVVALAFLTGMAIDGRVEGWIVWGLNWLSGQVGRLFDWAVDWDAEAVAAVVPGAVGLALVIVVVKNMWPKKGKPDEVTAVAALFVPLLWAALTSALDKLQTGIGA